MYFFCCFSGKEKEYIQVVSKHMNDIQPPLGMKNKNTVIDQLHTD